MPKNKYIQQTSRISLAPRRRNTYAISPTLAKMHKAIEDMDYNTIRAILSIGDLKIQELDYNNRNILHHAAAISDSNILHIILAHIRLTAPEQVAHLITHLNLNRHSPLHIAVKHGNLESFEELMAYFTPQMSAAEEHKTLHTVTVFSKEHQQLAITSIITQRFQNDTNMTNPSLLDICEQSTAKLTSINYHAQIRKALAIGADIQVRHRVYNPTLFAATKAHATLFKLLLEYGGYPEDSETLSGLHNILLNKGLASERQCLAILNEFAQTTEVAKQVEPIDDENVAQSTLHIRELKMLKRNAALQGSRVILCVSACAAMIFLVFMITIGLFLDKKLIDVKITLLSALSVALLCAIGVFFGVIADMAINGKPAITSALVIEEPVEYSANNVTSALG